MRRLSDSNSAKSANVNLLRRERPLLHPKHHGADYFVRRGSRGAGGIMAGPYKTEFLETAAGWPQAPSGEVKGRLLQEGHFVEALTLLEKHGVLIEAAAIDMGLHTEAETISRAGICKPTANYRRGKYGGLAVDFGADEHCHSGDF